MKGLQGLVVAVLLGALALVLNWVYLTKKTEGVETVDFLGVKEGTTIEPGEKFRKEHFVAIQVPQDHAGNLDQFVHPYADLNTVVGEGALRRYQGGDLLFRTDLATAPPELDRMPGEAIIWISVNSHGFVPDLIDPGDRIMFIVSEFKRASVTSPDGEQDTRELKRLGPFVVKAVGNRLGDAKVMRAQRMSQRNEREIAISVKMEGDGFEHEAEELLKNKGNQNLSVVLMPPE